MMRCRVDPDLVGQWQMPGRPQTYEITGDGGYHIAEPAQPLRFADDGSRMIWGKDRFQRLSGLGDSLIGTWLEVSSGEVWTFAQDYTYTIRVDGPDGRRTYTGLWGQVAGGSAMWLRELRGFVASNDNEDGLTILTSVGYKHEYAYSKAQGAWSLRSAEDGQVLTQFCRAEARDAFAMAAQ